MESYSKLKLLMRYYGYEVQREQFAEECAEAILAIQKCKRYGTRKALNDLEGEVADVIVMAMQMAMFLGEDKIKSIIEDKIYRQMDRVEDIEGIDIWDKLKGNRRRDDDEP